MLTGPNLAREVALGHPAACVVALPDEDLARRVQELVHSRDVSHLQAAPTWWGARWAGATKNVMAIAAGVSDGLGLGEDDRGPS